MSVPSARKGGSVSRFEAAVKRRADRLGKSVQQLLADDRVALHTSSYPGPECLNPYEVEHFFGMDLREDRVAHVEECPMCAALLDAAQPTEKALAQFIDEYRRAKATEPLAEPRVETENPVRRPLIDVLGVEVPIVVAVFAVAAFGIWMVHDTIMTNLLSTIALRSVTVVFVAALLFALLTAAAAKWLKLGRGVTFQRFGGAAIGGVFGFLLVFYGAKLSFDVSSAYSSLETAQNALLTAIAEQRKTGHFPSNNLANGNVSLKVTASSDGGLFSATSTNFAGKLIAQGQQNSIDVYWDLGERRSLGRIYQGTLERDANGEVNVLTGTEKIAVRSSFFERALGTGTRVLVLVPTNDDEASKILPIDQAARDTVVPGSSRD